jgi:sulfite exporter TauE/SafE
MLPWLMILAGGLLGSSHCAGMCGGFALALGSNRRGLLRNLARQVVYSLGRVFTYATAGAAASYGGWRLAGELRLLVNVQAVLCVAAGVLLIVQGLAGAGVLRRLPTLFRSRTCLGAGLFGSLLRETRLPSVFLGGVVNGLLPCGLVYAYLALAASSGGLMAGGLTMALFGLGTMPMLALVGCGGQLLGVAARRHVFRVAAWCVVLTGVLSLGRGIAALRMPGADGGPNCPMCVREPAEAAPG